METPGPLQTCILVTTAPHGVVAMVNVQRPDACEYLQSPTPPCLVSVLSWNWISVIISSSRCCHGNWMHMSFRAYNIVLNVLNSFVK